jgi:hypothetical protein
MTIATPTPAQEQQVTIGRPVPFEILDPPWLEGREQAQLATKGIFGINGARINGVRVETNAYQSDSCADSKIFFSREMNSAQNLSSPARQTGLPMTNWTTPLSSWQWRPRIFHYTWLLTKKPSKPSVYQLIWLPHKVA